MEGLDIQFNGEVQMPVLVPGEEKHMSPWTLMSLDDGLAARSYLSQVLKGRKLERFYDFAADKRPDVIRELINSYGLSFAYTRRNAKPGMKFNKESPIKHKAVIMEVMKVLSPNAKERYGKQLASIAERERLRVNGKPDKYGFSVKSNPANKTFRMTNINTLEKQVPMNLASEIRMRGRTRSIKNNLMASTWSNGQKVAKREGINTSAYNGTKTRRN